jgi:3-methyladenine DNA glycosylase AlkD
MSAMTDRAASAAAITRDLRGRADPEAARFLQGFFKTGPGEYGEGDVFLGIRVPTTRKLVARYRDSDLTEIGKLLESRFHEARLLALLVLVYRFQRGDVRIRREVYAMYRSHLRWVNNWDLVDGSAEHIVGGHLVNRSRRPLYQLAASPNVWRRRIAIIATLHFIRQGEFGETLDLAAALLDDEHDLIHKAVGWMLREVGKRSRKTEEAFLEQRYRIMPRTMLRYAIEHFPDKQRKAYLTGSI